MPAFIQTEAYDVKIAAAISAAAAAAGLYNGAQIAMFTNNVNPTKTTVLADLTMATFAGVGANNVVWSVPFRDLDGFIHLQTDLQDWAGTGVGLPTLVHGIFLMDTTSTFLIGAQLFDTPFNFADPLSHLRGLLDLVMGQGQLGGFAQEP